MTAEYGEETGVAGRGRGTGIARGGNASHGNEAVRWAENDADCCGPDAGQALLHSPKSLASCISCAAQSMSSKRDMKEAFTPPSAPTLQSIEKGVLPCQAPKRGPGVADGVCRQGTVLGLASAAGVASTDIGESASRNDTRARAGVEMVAFGNSGVFGAATKLELSPPRLAREILIGEAWIPELCREVLGSAFSPSRSAKLTPLCADRW